MIAKIVSGGQTGVDRAALDTAIEMGIPHSGWCPKGRRAEDGPLPTRYALTETPLADYPQRTEWNVRDSHGTLILTSSQMGEGTRLTVQIAQMLGRPYLVVDMDAGRPVSAVVEWAAANWIGVLNVAGPRESTSPGCYEKARVFLVGLLLAACK